MESGPEALQGIESISAADFIGGILHQLAKRSSGQKFYFDTRDRKLHAAFAATYQHLRNQADGRDQSLDFSIFPDPIHGDSLTVSEELRYLLFHGPVEGHFGSFVRVVYNANDPTAEVVAEFAGSPELYSELATIFTEAYYAPPQTS